MSICINFTLAFLSNYYEFSFEVEQELGSYLHFFAKLKAYADKTELFQTFCKDINLFLL
jgi:hypothetical protein